MSNTLYLDFNFATGKPQHTVLEPKKGYEKIEVVNPTTAEKKTKYRYTFYKDFKVVFKGIRKEIDKFKGRVLRIHLSPVSKPDMDLFLDLPTKGGNTDINNFVESLITVLPSLNVGGEYSLVTYRMQKSDTNKYERRVFTFKEDVQGIETWVKSHLAFADNEEGLPVIPRLNFIEKDGKLTVDKRSRLEREEFFEDRLTEWLPRLEGAAQTSQNVDGFDVFLSTQDDSGESDPAPKQDTTSAKPNPQPATADTSTDITTADMEGNDIDDLPF